MKKDTAKLRTITDLSAAYGFLAAQDDEQMLVLFGEPGTGKSTAAQYLANQRKAIYVSAKPKMTPFRLVKTILNAVGLTCRGLGEGLDKLVNLLRSTRQALFIDEIDWLLHDNILLEVLRSIHDDAGVPVIMIGMPGIYNRFAQHRQLCDRIHFLEFEACDLSDTKLLAATRCEIRIDSDLLSIIHQKAMGNIRLVKRMMAYVESHALEMGWDSCNVQKWGNQLLLPNYAQKPMKKRGAA